MLILVLVLVLVFFVVSNSTALPRPLGEAEARESLTRRQLLPCPALFLGARGRRTLLRRRAPATRGDRPTRSGWRSERERIWSCPTAPVLLV